MSDPGYCLHPDSRWVSTVGRKSISESHSFLPELTIKSLYMEVIWATQTYPTKLTQDKSTSLFKKILILIGG